MSAVLIAIGAFVALSFALGLLFGRAGKPTARMQPRPPGPRKGKR